MESDNRFRMPAACITLQTIWIFERWLNVDRVEAKALELGNEPSKARHLAVWFYHWTSDTHGIMGIDLIHQIYGGVTTSPALEVYESLWQDFLEELANGA